jgi:hypothetical protein
VRSLIFGVALFWVFIGGAYAFFGSKQVFKYDKLLGVVNQTGEVGYFSVCNKPIDPESESLCSIPQKVEIGTNRVFVPGLQTAYIAFATADDVLYTCGTQAEPKKQLTIPLQQNVRTIVIGPFITNQDGNKLAIGCGLGQ